MKLKQRVLNALKKLGYTGDAQLVNVKKWLEEQDYPIDVIKVGDVEHKIDEVFAPATKALELTVEAEEAAPAGTKARGNGGDSSRETNNVTAALGAEDLDIKVIGDYRAQSKDSYNHRAKSGRVRKGQKNVGTVFANANMAEAFGALLRMTLADINPSVKGMYGQAAVDREIVKKTMAIFPETAGGLLIPQQFSNEIVRLVEDYGVFRASAKYEPMTNHTLDLSRRTAGVTGAWTSESGSPAASNPTYDQIKVTTDKRMTLSKVTNELLNDTPVNIADQIATEVAQDFSNAEDDAGFNGTGASTYGGFIGLLFKFRQIVEAAGGTWGDADGVKQAGIVLAAGNTFAEISLQNILDMIGRLPKYVWKRGTPKFYCHSQFYWSVVERLGIATDTNANILNGVPSFRFRGIPVEEVQVMPNVDANSQIPLILGDISMAAKFGEVRGSMRIDRSEHVYWATDEIGFRGVERVGIKVHDVGNYHATAASRVAGPVVALLTTAA